MINKYYTKVKIPAILLVASVFLLFSACREATVSPYKIVQNATAESAMVVAGHPLAAKVGVKIMKAGGNAVDAAIATQFALAVVHPRAGNIGGGGFMVIRMANGDKTALDFREEAPSGAGRDMYLDSMEEVVPGLSREGHLSVGVPGSVAGMAEAFEKYSKLKDWKMLLQPAIDLAKDGFAITRSEAERLNRYHDTFLKNNADPRPFVINGKWQMGDMLVQNDLARTLERIRDHGKAGFYEGETARMIVDEMQRGKGLITREDLKNYRAKWKKPIEGDYKEYHIITMPPSSSGGIALMQLLTILKNYPLGKYGFQSAKAVHTIVEAERRVYADRAKFLGDDDYYPVPKDTLLDEQYLALRMTDFDPDSATLSEAVQSGNFSMKVESFETTHYSVIDAFGNAVSVTTTLNLNYGSKVLVAGAGFFLNDEMDDFSAKPGVPNYFGLIGAKANAIEPGKRMLSSMTPTIVEKNGNLFLVLGAPGGSTIITAVLQTILNVTDFGMSIGDAVSAPRFHHQWLPDEISVEGKAIDTLVRKELWDMGHHLRGVDRMAVMKAIEVLPDGKLVGAGDWRNQDDHVEGY